MLEIEQHAVDGRLGIGQRLAQRADGSAQQVLLFQSRDPVRGGVGGEGIAETALQIGLVGALAGEVGILR